MATALARLTSKTHIDHSRLLGELELRTSSVELPRLLIALLTEVQGRPFGLPQLVDSSDELSEIYARIIERELRRRGIDVWRYNDDFRISAKTYDEAQAHVEALAREASAVGLILNENKTRIVKFENYFWKNWSGPKTEGDIEFKPELIEIFGEYGELDDDELVDVAHETFAKLRTGPSEDEHIDPKNLSPDDNRALSHAISILTRYNDPYGLDDIPKLFEYASHFSHRLGAYLDALQNAGTDVGPTWDVLVARSDFFNAWQRVWLVYVARVGRLLDKRSRRAWVRSQRADIDPLLRAEATLAVAQYGSASFAEIDRAVRVEPEALVPWYALAAKVTPKIDQRQLRALKESHGLVEILLYQASARRPKT